jgi:hypothetical protein
MTADRHDSGLIHLGDDLLFMLFDYMPVYDLFHTVTLVCHCFGKLLREAVFMSRLTQRKSGIRKCLPKWLKLIHRELMQTELHAEQLLQFEGATSSTDCYRHQARYQVDNMFAYSPSLFIAGGQAQNVLAKALFTGAYDSRAKFKEDVHEDMLWAQQFEIPARYRPARLLDDNFLTNKSSRSILDVYQGNEFNTSADLALLLPPAETTAPLIVKSALISRIGVGRPTFTAHPVRTLLISTRLPSSNPTDIKSFSRLDSLEKVKKCADLKIETIHSNCGSTLIEFDGTDGPLLWIQFSDCLLVQTEVALLARRRATQMEVLVIDSEDRKEEFGGGEKGVAICYVVAAGWAVESLGG